MLKPSTRRPSPDTTLHAVRRILARDTEMAGDSGHQLDELVRQMAADGNPRRQDPSREILARLGDKWSPLLLLVLRAGPFRHATLRRLVGTIATEGDISQRMLTLRLRALERDGLITRRIISAVPAAVTYTLTEAGAGLTMQLQALLAWTREHSETIRAARERFDGGHTGIRPARIRV